MSSFDRRRFLSLAVVLPVAACQFRPAMQRGEPAAALPGRIAVSVPGGKTEYHLEERLRHQLGYAGGDPEFRLEVSLEFEDRAATAAGSGGIDRGMIEGTAEFVVNRAGDGEKVSGGEVQGWVTYTMGRETVAADSARADAERRLANQLADRIVTVLVATAGDWAA